MPKSLPSEAPPRIEPPAHPSAFEPTDEQRKMVWASVVADTPASKIAALLRISEQTLRDHFRHELDNAKAEMDALALSVLRRARKIGKG